MGKVQLQERGRGRNRERQNENSLKLPFTAKRSYCRPLGRRRWTSLGAGLCLWPQEWKKGTFFSFSSPSVFFFKIRTELNTFLVLITLHSQRKNKHYTTVPSTDTHKPTQIESIGFLYWDDSKARHFVRPLSRLRGWMFVYDTMDTYGL